jgi:hypothetical protein
MRKLCSTGWVTLFLLPVTVAQQPANPLFAPPAGDGFNSQFFTAPGTRTLPDGTEVPPPVPEAVLGPGVPLRGARVWLSADYFHAVGRGLRLPALVTSSPAGTDAAIAGVLGRNTTTIQFGGNQWSQMRPGMRADGGLWLGERFGVDGSFVFLSDTSESFRGVSGPGGPTLAQPVVSGLTGAEGAVPIGLLGPGSITATADTFTIGGEANLRYNASRSEFGRWDVFAGYRYLHLRDGVTVATDRFVPNPADGPALGVQVSDQFRSRNDFHGPQVGVAGSYRLFDRLTFSTRLSLAMGVTLSDVRLNGSTVSSLGNSAVGLLVGGTNAGTYTRTDFAVIPAADARFGYDITDWLRLSVGYNFTYWSSVRRAADQIDRTLLAPGRPAYRGDTTDYWVQGVLLGVEVRY